MDVALVPWSPEDQWVPERVVLAHHVLSHAGRLRAARGEDGEVITDSPLAGTVGVKQRYPVWALGPFGRIEIEQQLPASPGVFAVFGAGRVRYVGSTDHLERWFGPRGLAQISRRDCEHTSREEMCRLNRNITAEALAGRQVDLYLKTIPQVEGAIAVAAQVQAWSRGDWHLPE